MAQPAIRHNRLIEALEQGEPAITGEVWTFIDQEHGPYVIDQLGTRLGELALERNDRGQQILAPIVRIPAEGDQSLRWIVKQVLERGAMGIIVPQVENAEQATRIVVTSGQASISYLQRRLRIGFSRAARLVDMMEADGLVSSGTTGKPREILVKPDYFEEIDSKRNKTVLNK